MFERLSLAQKIARQDLITKAFNQYIKQNVAPTAQPEAFLAKTFPTQPRTFDDQKLLAVITKSLSTQRNLSVSDIMMQLRNSNPRFWENKSIKDPDEQVDYVYDCIFKHLSDEANQAIRQTTNNLVAEWEKEDALLKRGQSKFLSITGLDKTAKNLESILASMKNTKSITRADAEGLSTIFKAIYRNGVKDPDATKKIEALKTAFIEAGMKPEQCNSMMSSFTNKFREFDNAQNAIDRLTQDRSKLMDIHKNNEKTQKKIAGLEGDRNKILLKKTPDAQEAAKLKSIDSSIAKLEATLKHDVSPIQINEVSHQIAEQTAALNRAMDNFSSTVNHEVNVKLSGVSPPTAAPLDASRQNEAARMKSAMEDMAAIERLVGKLGDPKSDVRPSVLIKSINEKCQSFELKFQSELSKKGPIQQTYSAVSSNVQSAIEVLERIRQSSSKTSRALMSGSNSANAVAPIIENDRPKRRGP